jgi:hypothetical protein
VEWLGVLPSSRREVQSGRPIPTSTRWLPVSTVLGVGSARGRARVAFGVGCNRAAGPSSAVPAWVWREGRISYVVFPKEGWNSRPCGRPGQAKGEAGVYHQRWATRSTGEAGRGRLTLIASKLTVLCNHPCGEGAEWRKGGRGKGER